MAAIAIVVAAGAAAILLAVGGGGGRSNARHGPATPGRVPVSGKGSSASADAARQLAVEPVIVPVHGSSEIEAVMTKLGNEPGGALILVPDASIFAHRKMIIELADRYRLPSIYFSSGFAADGGLLSYGPDVFDQFQKASAYVDQILRGKKAGDLPVQQPTKFELVINLKTAKTLGLDVPASLLARADAVIE